MIELDTPRLKLRMLKDDDAAFIERLVNDPDWLRYIGDRNVHSHADAIRYMDEGPRSMYARRGFGLLAVERKDDGATLGLCGLIKRETLDDVDIGFAFLPEHRGAGYAGEAAAACIRQAETLGLRRIVAITSLDNDSSGKLLEKLGFRLEREMVEAATGVTLKLFALELL